MVLEPDVILMDMALPKKNGMEAAELILQNQANVKIIAMSAIEEDWIGQKAIESGCVAFLPKPFDHIALLSYIREVETSESEVKYG